MLNELNILSAFCSEYGTAYTCTLIQTDPTTIPAMKGAMHYVRNL